MKPQLLSYDDLQELGIRYSRAHLWRLQARGLFPKPIKLTPTARNVWPADEIHGWMAALVAERDGAGAYGSKS